MNTDFAILLAWFCTSATANGALGIALYRTSRRLRRLEERPQEMSRLDDVAARVEQSVDALATRVEELAGAQEFMNRVLADRLEKLGRVLPPHDPRDASP